MESVTPKPLNQDVIVLRTGKGLSNCEVWIQKERGEIHHPFSIFLLLIESKNPNEEHTDRLSAETAKPLSSLLRSPLSDVVFCVHIVLTGNDWEGAQPQKPLKSVCWGGTAGAMLWPAGEGHMILQKPDSVDLLWGFLLGVSLGCLDDLKEAERGLPMGVTRERTEGSLPWLQFLLPSLAFTSARRLQGRRQ